MLPFDPADLRYEPLSGDCLTGAFSCGESEIDGWFKKKAIGAHDKFDCRITTVYADADEVPVAFYALSHIAEEERRLGENPRSKEYFPSLHLEWLAVRTDLQGNGLGAIIMGRVIDIFVQAALVSALPALTLVALNDRAEQFYQSLGFRRYALGEIGAGKRMLLLAEIALKLQQVA